MSQIDYASEYQKLHALTPTAFSGYSTEQYVHIITQMVQYHKPKSLLDFGSGKGYQYLERRIHEAWGILPHCYDPGVPQLQAFPTQEFDGLICVDVLEHIHRKDLNKTLKLMLSFLDDTKPTFAFLGIDCKLAKKNFTKGGRNLHLTVEEPEWWENLLTRFGQAYPKITIRREYQT